MRKQRLSKRRYGRGVFDRRGASGPEYAMLVGLVAVTAAAGAELAGTSVAGLMSRIGDQAQVAASRVNGSPVFQSGQLANAKFVAGSTSGNTITATFSHPEGADLTFSKAGAEWPDGLRLVEGTATGSRNRVIPAGVALAADGQTVRVDGPPSEAGTFKGLRIAAADDDGDVVKTPPFAVTVEEPQELVYGFESGSLGSDWTRTDNLTVADMSAMRNGSPVAGNYVVRPSNWSNNDGNAPKARLEPDALRGGKKISVFEVKWWETAWQTGFEIELVDSNNDPVVTMGSDNPQWKITERGSFQFVGHGNNFGSPYRDWTTYRLEFDWDNHRVRYKFSEGGNGMSSGWINLPNDAENVEHIRFGNNAFGQCCGAGNATALDSLRIKP